MSDASLDAVRAYLARVHPGLTPEGREQRLQALLHRPHTEVATYVQHPDGKAPEAALTAFWQDPTADRANAYIRALLPVLRTMRKAERRPTTGSHVPPPLKEAFQIGPYRLVELLGSGGDGVVCRAEHDDSGAVVALKVNARGDALLPDVVGDDWPESVLRTLDTGTWGPWLCAVRELADETLHDVMVGNQPRCCDLRLALEVFRVACEGVAWLHSHHVYGWSAHSKNVYRLGERWKIGDFGRVWCFVPPDHPSLEQERREQFYPVLGADDDQARQVADWLIARHRFGHWTAAGLLSYDPEREHRLRLDDLSMVGGLLVEMLTGKRWEWFFRALNAHPYCSAKYPLTDDRARDAHLSAIVNRCWRGDAGGAPLLANGDRGEQTVYDDPLELLEDVTQVAIATAPLPRSPLAA